MAVAGEAEAATGLRLKPRSEPQPEIFFQAACREPHVRMQSHALRPRHVQLHGCRQPALSPSLPSSARLFIRLGATDLGCNEAKATASRLHQAHKLHAAVGQS